MRLEIEIKNFFNRTLFTPPEDSASVREEFQKILETNKKESFNFTSQNQLKPTNLENLETLKSVPFELIHQIKYIARKHGLPLILCPKLISSFQDATSVHIQYQIAQGLKYALVKESRFVSFAQIFSLLDKFTKEFSPNDPHVVLELSEDESSEALLYGIISELVEGIAIKAEATDGYDGSVIQKVKPFLPYLDSELESKVNRIFGEWEKNVSVIQGEADLDELLFLTNDASIQKSKTPEDEPIGQFGDTIFAKSSLAQKHSKEVKADAVKTQQVISTNYKQNISEKSEVESISLANALNSGRSKSVARTLAPTISPGESGGSGSDMWFYQSTGSGITTLHDLATRGKTIKEDDINWLVGKTVEGYYITNLTVTLYEQGRIAGIFQMISKYQKLQEEWLTSLAKNYFSKELDASYESILEKFLSAFLTYAEVNPGILPSRVEEYLNSFKRFNTCTALMRKLIWKTLVQNDDNYMESFKSSLAAIQEYNDTEYIFDHLDYIGSQVAIEYRANHLETSSPYMEILLGITMDAGYSTKVRSRVAEIIESYLDWDPVGLSSEWQIKFLEQFKQLEEQGK